MSGTLRDDGLNHEEPWKDPVLLHWFLNELDCTVKELGEYFPVSYSSIHSWARRKGVVGDPPDRDEYDLSGVTYSNPETLEYLYHEEELTITDIAYLFDCAPSTVSSHLKKNGIKTRDPTEAAYVSYGTQRKVSFRTREFGHEVWKNHDDTVLVHRLLAVAEYGLEALEDKQVHHINGIGWDNRPENITLVGEVEHQKLHKKVEGLDRLRLAELYENGDVGCRPLAEHVEYDISSTTVLKAHKEFFGGDLRA